MCMCVHEFCTLLQGILDFLCGDGGVCFALDAEYPVSDTQAKRNSYQMSQDANSPNSAEQSSLCYFIQESEIESQISCRLRFTRSKFNFNPFGLRFGKRQQGSLASKRDPITLSSIKKLPSLLKFKLNQMVPRCGDFGEQDC